MKEFNYSPDDGDEQAIARGGVAIPCPWRLHQMLKVTADEGLQDIVSWAPHGRAFTVHKPKEFADHVLTRYGVIFGLEWKARSYSKKLIDTTYPLLLAEFGFCSPLNKIDSFRRRSIPVSRDN